MALVARVGDCGHGICYAHDQPTEFNTTFVEGVANVMINGQQMITVGGLGVTTCGHHTIATTGASSTNGSGKALHRVGDVGTVVEDSRGHYVCTSGSPNVDCGG